MNIAICDDEPAQAELLARRARKWAEERMINAAVGQYNGADAFLFAWEESGCDVLLLDIQMPGMDGMTLARHIRERDEQIAVVFVTNYADYIYEGYDVSALHYLMKPVSDEKLFAVLDRAAENRKRFGRALSLNADGATIYLPLNEIRYLEVRQNYVTVHAKEEYTVKKTLGELEKGLDDGFFRTGRSFIVHLLYVRKITKTDVVLKDGALVPLSHGVYHAINRAMIRYFKEI